MKKIIFLMLLSLLAQGCNSQKTKPVESHPYASSNDSLQPQVDIRVNKKFDDKGNLVQFDSTYTYYYSSKGGKLQQLNADSLYAQFRTMFRSQYDDWFDRSFNPVFFNDSLFKYDFMNSDYFDRRFELNKPIFRDLFRDMDSLKADMLSRHFPNGEMKRKK